MYAAGPILRTPLDRRNPRGVGTTRALSVLDRRMLHRRTGTARCLPIHPYPATAPSKRTDARPCREMVGRVGRSAALSDELHLRNSSPHPWTSPMESSINVGRAVGGSSSVAMRQRWRHGLFTGTGSIGGSSCVRLLLRLASSFAGRGHRPRALLIDRLPDLSTGKMQRRGRRIIRKRTPCVWGKPGRRGREGATFCMSQRSACHSVQSAYTARVIRKSVARNDRTMM